MTFERLLKEQRAVREPTSRDEIEELRALARRCLDDATSSAEAAYFNVCRMLRNQLSYESAGVISASELEEILCKAPKFELAVERWLAEHHPELGDP